MPWNEPGKGNKDPWGSGDQQPPDLEEVFQKVNARLKTIFGGGSGGSDKASGNGGMGAVVPLLLVAVVLWAGWDAVHIIDQAERGVVLRFGKYHRTLSPGFNMTLPRPIEQTLTVNISNVRSVNDQGHMLSADENLVELAYSVQYRVNDAMAFLFKLRDPELTLRQAAESALRESVGTNILDFILSGVGRESVGVETERVLQETLDRYQSGIQITQFNLERSTAPAPVLAAFEDVNKAREDRQRFIEEARVHANSVVPEARGHAARILQEAEGYKVSTIALANGEAQRFQLLLTEYQLAPKITRKRLYLQTMEGVFGRSTKILLDADSSGNVLYLPLDQLGGGGATGSRNMRMPPVVTPERIGIDSGSSSRNSRREGRQ